MNFGNSGEFFAERSWPEKDNGHFVSELPREDGGNVQDDHLGAVGIGIVADDDDLVLGFALRAVGQGARRGVQIGAPEAQIRLEIGGLRPFVPGIDKDEGFSLERVPRREVCRVAQPLLVACRGRPVIDGPSPAPARVVVPRGRNTAYQRIIRSGHGA